MTKTDNSVVQIGRDWLEVYPHEVVHIHIGTLSDGSITLECGGDLSSDFMRYLKGPASTQSDLISAIDTIAANHDHGLYSKGRVHVTRAKFTEVVKSMRSVLDEMYGTVAFDLSPDCGISDNSSNAFDFRREVGCSHNGVLIEALREVATDYPAGDNAPRAIKLTGFDI